MPEPKARMRRRYVNRHGVWLRAQRITPAHRNPGEAVYIRRGPGDFEKIGVVNKHGGLPAAYL
jgi:hypothetical protein